MSKLKKRLFSFLLVAILILVVFYCGYGVGKVTEGKIQIKFNSNLYQTTALPDLFNNKILQEVYSVLKNDYFVKDKIKDQELFYGAVEGLVAALEDPHTNFFDPDKTTNFETQINGEFQGIGAEIGSKDGYIVIVAPFDDSPAQKAGLRSGDKILSVDGNDITGITTDEAVKLIRGPKGTVVKLMILSKNQFPREVSITRDIILLKSVKWQLREDKLLYVALQGFNADTMGLLMQMVAETKDKKVKGIILDLRNDPGGLLETGIAVSSLWIDKGTIVIERFSDGSEVVHEASGNTLFKKYPTVVLINEGSASASEILAGAFQDYGIGKVVGKTSFGKGSVQVLKKLEDGSSIKVTIGKWFTPKGRTIDKEGIKPDVEVDYTIEDLKNDKDPQLDKAIELLKN